MSEIQKLVVRMTADNGKLHSQLDQSSRKLKGFGDTAKSVTSGIGSAFAALGVGLSLTAFASSIKSVIDEADELSKLSQSVGVSVESLSGLQYAADLSGVSLDQLGTGLKRLAVNASDTARGTGEAKDAFAALGVSVLDASGNLKDSDKLLLELADKFAGLQDGAGKSALAIKILGKAGADMIPLLNGGADGIRAMTDEAAQFNLIVNEDMAKASERFNDNLTRLTAAGKGLKFEMAEQLLPALENITTAMVAAAKEAGLLEALLVGIGGAMYHIAVPADRVKNSIKNLNNEIANAEANLNSLLAIPANNRAGTGVDSEIARLRAQVADYKALRNDLANPVKVLGPTSVAGGSTKKPAPLIADPKAAADAARAAAKAASDAAKAMADAAREQEAYQKSLQSLIEKLDPAIAKQREFGESVALLTVAYERGDLGIAEYGQRVGELRAEFDGSAEAARNHADALAAVFETAKSSVDPISAMVDELALLSELLDTPVGEQYGDILLARMMQIQDEMEGIGDKAEETTDAMSEFALEAARNMQSAFADFLFDPFEGGVDDMAKNFGKVLQRMIAEAAAAQIFEALGGLGGPVGGFFGALTGGAKAAGTSFASGGPTLVGERGPEVVNLPRGAQVIPSHKLGGGGAPNITVNVSGMGNAGEVRRAAGQGAREALSALSGAQRYA